MRSNLVRGKDILCAYLTPIYPELSTSVYSVYTVSPLLRGMSASLVHCVGRPALAFMCAQI